MARYRANRDNRETEPQRNERLKNASEAELRKIRQHYEREAQAAKNIANQQRKK